MAREQLWLLSGIRQGSKEVREVGRIMMEEAHGSTPAASLDKLIRRQMFCSAAGLESVQLWVVPQMGNQGTVC